MVWNDTRGRGSPTETAPVLDMTPDGQFVDPSPGAAPPLAARVIGVAVVVAVLAGVLGFALLALWLASILIPVALVAGLIAYGVFRVQVWRAGSALRGGGSLRSQGNPFGR